MATAVAETATATAPTCADIVSLTDGPETTHSQVFAVCKHALAGWGSLQYPDVEFTKVTGGITNILVKVTPAAQHGLEPVAVKVFGAKTDMLIDRGMETAVAQGLAGHGFGPKVLCIFGNGRVEQFLYCKTLRPEEMCSPEFVPRIAEVLARFHAATVQLPRTPRPLFETIWAWLDMARQLDFAHDAAKAVAFAQVDFEAMKRDIQALEAACAATGSPIVFGHNDLLAGNILVLQDKGFDPQQPDPSGPMQLIDFEYCAYTPRGFDIGNHFNEYAGFECDFSRYPTREQQAVFFRAYAAAQAAQQAAAGQPAAEPLTDAELERLCAEADVHALASHAYWGVWALIQACYSPVEFDYMSYSALRWGECRRKWDGFMGQARKVFGPSDGQP